MSGNRPISSLPKQEKAEALRTISRSYLDGQSCIQIGKHFGMHETAVRYWVKKMGIHMRTTPDTYEIKRKSLARQIESYRRLGFKNYEIAEKLGCSAYHISQVMPYKRKYILQLIINLYDAGASLTQIGEINNVTGRAVSYQLTKIGVKLRGRGGPNHIKWQGKKIPCANGCGRYAQTKGMCKLCYNLGLYYKNKRNKKWELMQQEYTVV